MASLFVYDGPVLADVIGGYWFNGKTLIGYVDIEVGESVDFQVNGGFYPAEYSYKVEDEEGNVIVDQVEAFEPAEDVLDVVICTLSDIAETDGKESQAMIELRQMNHDFFTGKQGWTCVNG